MAQETAQGPQEMTWELIGWSQFNNFQYEAMCYQLQKKVMGPTAHLYSPHTLQHKLI